MPITRDNSLTFPVRTTVTRKHSWESIPPSTNSAYYRLIRKRTGQALRNWRSIIESGGNATTPLSATYDSISRTLGSPVVYKGKRVSGETIFDICEGDYTLIGYNRSFTQVGDPSTSSAFADNLARARFYNKLADRNTSSFQGGVFLGELRETVHMLHHPAAAIYAGSHSFLRALKKTKRSRARALVSTASDLWLEYAFGWIPLLLDCKDFVAAYNKKIRQPVPKSVISGGGQVSYDTSSNLQPTDKEGYTFALGVGMPTLAIRNVVSKNVHTVRYKGAVHTQVEAPPIGWSDLLNFNPQNFVPTLWELLPWSFLADYFANIGDILNASAVATQNLSYANKTVISENVYSMRSEIAGVPSPGAFWTVSASGGGQGFESKRRIVTRSPGTGVPLPTLSVDYQLTSGQLANIAALLGSSLGIKRNGFDIASLFRSADSIHPQRFNFKR